MRLSNGQMLLRTMCHSDIERVREWRNARHVRTKLLHQVEITREQQESWFATRNSASEIYFIMEVDDRQAGLIYATNVDPINLSFEGNIFIGEPAFLDTSIAVKATIMVSDLFFRLLDFQMAYSLVVRGNDSAEMLDTSLGYKLFEEEEGHARFRCLRDDYFQSTRKLRRLFFRNHRWMTIEAEASDTAYTFTGQTEKIIETRKLELFDLDATTKAP